jgi:cytochrome o ubiquinol oxidase subunit 1
VIIAVPTGVKVFHWLFTLYRGRARISASLGWVLGFFAVGGMSGVLLALPPADFVLHNSLFLVAHFHNMLIPGALFAYLAGYVCWFPEANRQRLKPSTSSGMKAR